MRVTLRLVIGILCALMVIIVAAITLGITYSVALSSIRLVGQRHAQALAYMTRYRTEDFFNNTVQALNGVAGQFDLQGMNSPQLDPQFGTVDLLLKYYYSQYRLNSAGYFKYGSSGFIFDDASGTTSYAVTKTITSFNMQVCTDYPKATTFMGLQKFVNTITNQEVAAPTGSSSVPLTDARIPGYFTVKTIAGTSQRGMWFPITTFVPPDATATLPESWFVYPAIIPLHNRSNQFIGVGLVAQPVSQINAFLADARSTPNTEAFAVDSTGFIVGSSHTVSTFRVYSTTSANAIFPAGCSTSSATSFNTSVLWIGCLTAAADFTAYAPLSSIASSDPDVLKATSTVVRFTTIAGDNFFFVSTPVSNAFNFWQMNIVVFLPEGDVIGDVVAGRNLAIGVTAAVTLVFAVLSVVLISVLLRPLSTVSKKMLQTAKLKDVADDESNSAMAEIQDLQTAYANMSKAIQSFTRYVPRDVVKDLMSTGQLCSINMAPLRCSILFVDIANFTTVCERVPPDVLSLLVTQYFDRASRIVMSHDGLIDKYIGDCIMVVWGAPFLVANHEVKAALTGLLIDRETLVDPLAKTWDEAGELLRVRVGISTGEVLAGNMGSQERMNYTVIGDNVNLSARLESMNKMFGTRVMVSETTAQRLGGIFITRLLLPIAVVGKDVGVRVFEVMGLAKHIDASYLEDLEIEDRKCNISTETGNSEMSRVNAPPTPTYRSSDKTTGNLVRDAVVRCSADRSLVCTEEVVAFAAEHSHAVNAYVKKDFRGAATTFEKLHATAARLTDSELTTGRLSNLPKSIAVVHGLCEKYMVQGAPSDFDGTFKALEK